jgi:hypothetical protein
VEVRRHDSERRIWHEKEIDFGSAKPGDPKVDILREFTTECWKVMSRVREEVFSSVGTFGLRDTIRQCKHPPQKLNVL